MKINYVPDLQHTIREGPAIYTYVDSACPLFLESRYFSARKMYAYYIKLTLYRFHNGLVKYLVMNISRNFQFQSDPKFINLENSNHLFT